MGKEKPIEDVLAGLGDPVEIPEAVRGSLQGKKRRCSPAKVQIMLQLKKWTLDFYTEMAKKEDDSRNKCLSKVLEEYARYEMEQKK